MTTSVSPARFADALDFDAYLSTVQKNAELWKGVHRTATVPADLVERANALGRPWHLLALSEDWCGDAVNTLPILARFVSVTRTLSLRVLSRDENLDLTDRHLTCGTRSIPVVIALDDTFTERGWWGPRPSTLQRWVRAEGMLLQKEDRYRHTRPWYARDRGRTTIREVLDMLERAERRRMEAAG